MKTEDGIEYRCPFCGYDGEPWFSMDDWCVPYIHCTKCYMSLSGYSEGRLIKLWNRLGAMELWKKLDVEEGS